MKEVTSYLEASIVKCTDAICETDISSLKSRLPVQNLSHLSVIASII